MAHLDPPQMKITQEELAAAKVPLGWRDFCAHLLVPLNECRRANFFLPWTCEDEKHVYEKCQYVEYKRRVQKAKAEQDGTH